MSFSGPQLLIVALISIIVGGTVFFHFIEGWGWVDAYFFTVITLSTVGYGSLVPQTVVGKLGTTLFIFVGLGLFSLAIHQFSDFTLRRRRRDRAVRIAKSEEAYVEAETGNGNSK